MAVSGKKLWLFRAVLVGFSLLLGLVAAEIFLRATHPPRPEFVDPQIHHELVKADPTAGRESCYYHMQPGQGYHLDVPVSINSLGLRGPEPSTDATTLRIVALGDSHTFGFGVAMEDTWPRQLQERMSGATKRPVEVINAGVQAHAIEQEIQLLEDRLLELRPEIVVLAYYWNDMPHFGNPQDAWTVGEPMLPGTMAVMQAQSSDHGASGAGTDTATLTSGNSSLVTKLKDAMRESYLLYTAVQKVPALQAQFFPTHVTAWRGALLRGETSDRIAASWEFVADRFQKLADLSATHGFEVVVLTIPIFEQMISSDPGPTYAGYQDKVEALSRRHGFAVLDPLPAVRGVDPSYPRDFVPFDGHPTGRIYGAVADVVAAHFKGTLL